MLGSAILELAGNLQQDVDGERYMVGTCFPELMQADPVSATVLVEEACDDVAKHGNPPSCGDDLREPALLVRREPVQLLADPLSIRWQDHYLQRGHAVVVEHDVHLLEHGEEALGGVAVRVDGVPGPLRHLRYQREVGPHGLLKPLVGDRGNLCFKVAEVAVDRGAEAYLAGHGNPRGSTRSPPAPPRLIAVPAWLSTCSYRSCA